MLTCDAAAKLDRVDSQGRYVTVYGRHGRGPDTPWGVAQDVVNYGPGVEFYETPSHGGFRLNDERQDAIERLWPEAGELVAGEWFEEDCHWAVVALAFPSLFEAKDVSLAAKIARAMPRMIASGIEAQEARGNATYVRRQEQRLVGWRVVADWIDDEGAEYLAPYLDDDRDGPTVVRIAE